jgi:predicted CoA-binding protein
MPTEREIVEVLRSAQTVAVVGASSNPARDSHTAVRYLKAQGYRVFPVNPNESEVDGLPAYPSLAALPERPDIVDVFRRPDETPPVARDAVAAGAHTLWLQSGIANDEARAAAESGGLTYVEDRCLYTTHRLMQRAGLLDTPESIVRKLARHERFDWVGIYWVEGEWLVLGSYEGKHPEGHERIRIPEGVCGAVAASGETEVVPDVTKRPGHIACEASTRSEVVAPIRRDARVMGVLDIDSNTLDAFGPEELALIEEVATRLGRLG